MATPNRTLFVIGSGPGIGRAVALQFSQQYSHIALFARRADQLAIDQKAIQEAAADDGDGHHHHHHHQQQQQKTKTKTKTKTRVESYAVDVTDTQALLAAYDRAEAAVGKPEVVFYNAARVLPSQLVTHEVKEIDYDFKINVSALYVTVQRYMDHLTQLAAADSQARPALLITSSLLPDHPIPQLFALSLVKAAQRNLARSLAMTYHHILVGLVVVGGPVSPDHPTLSPEHIAASTWAWFQQCRENRSFEVVIE